MVRSYRNKKDAVNRLIQRYDLLVANCDDQHRQLLEDLPVSLSYEIAAPSAESSEPRHQAKAAAPEGDIRITKKRPAGIDELGRIRFVLFEPWSPVLARIVIETLY